MKDDILNVSTDIGSVCIINPRDILFRINWGIMKNKKMINNWEIVFSQLYYIILFLK